MVEALYSLVLENFDLFGLSNFHALQTLKIKWKL